MTTSTITAPAELANPYAAEITAMPTESIDRLLKAKAADLTWYTRTVRNAVRGARRQGRTLYVGRTYTGAYITADADTLPLVEWAACADGTVWKYQGEHSAYSRP